MKGTEPSVRETGEEKRIRYENAVVSTRVRLARNLADYPFPNKLTDEESAREIIRLIAAELSGVDSFTLYYMNRLPEEKANLLKERLLISQDLINHSKISAALISEDETISVMINEEDHIREQYFMKGYDLKRAYERIAGIDEILSESAPFAFDRNLGYLTACPTNVGTGLRASVMLFLPALVRKKRLQALEPQLKKRGLVVRGAFGEGSGGDGYLFQISNEVTLGRSEEEILALVENAVDCLVAEECREREIWRREGGYALADRLLRAYGVLANCLSVGPEEFLRLITEIKLGVAFGVFDGNMGELDELLVDLRPANINRLNGAPLGQEEQNFYRAEYAGKALRGMELLTEQKRNELSPRK